MNILLAVDFITPFWENFIIIARYVVFGVILICALAIIISTLMQSGTNTSGASAVTGITESYYAQNRGSSREGRLQKITTLASIIMVVLIILVFVSCAFVPIG